MEAQTVKTTETTKITDLGPARAGRIWASAHYPNSDNPQVAESFLEVQHFVTEPAKASILLGMTLNLPPANPGEKSFEFVKVEVGCELPAYAEELTAAFEKATELAMERVAKEAADVKGWYVATREANS